MRGRARDGLALGPGDVLPVPMYFALPPDWRQRDCVNLQVVAPCRPGVGPRDPKRVAERIAGTVPAQADTAQMRADGIEV